jgi:hypothetical protein
MLGPAPDGWAWGAGSTPPATVWRTW